MLSLQELYPHHRDWAGTRYLGQNQLTGRSTATHRMKTGLKSYYEHQALPTRGRPSFPTACPPSGSIHFLSIRAQTRKKKYEIWPPDKAAITENYLKTITWIRTCVTMRNYEAPSAGTT